MRDSTLPSERRPARLGTLSVLPVFLDLAGRPALVAGGTDAAAWKAELLAAAGAMVRVRSATVGEEMAAFLASDERATLVRRPWVPADLDGMAFAVVDAVDDVDAARFRNAARAAGVPANAIDRPAFCDVRFGTVVNRSPVVVGISTDGAAPILGQAIRRRIESLLPRSLAAWGAFARDVRQRVMERMPHPGRRRAYWERLAEQALSGAAVPADTAPADSLIAAAGTPPIGRVTLVGAGPGDPDLVTLKAVRALQSADVILFDDLVFDGVLELARREAKRMLVGKRGGRISCRQADIDATMIALARQGRHVVRLKSGDPGVFGRGGEEIDRLSAAGIPVEVVPGVTAGLALAAELGVPLTHRDAAQSVRFVTGHSSTGGLPDTLDWRGLADPATTTVFYMGGRTASRIRDRLLAEGLTPETPVVVAANVSRPDARRWAGRLDRLGEGIAEIGWDDPVLVGIGRVFSRAAAEREGFRVAV